MDRANDPGSASYSLKLSEQEVARYRMMAASAADNEATEWERAGIAAGARIADIGCGPGAVLRLLAEHAGPDGRVVGIDADPTAVSLAKEHVADLPQAEVREGPADATGLEPGAYDVVVCRHVLAHNGGREGAIVSHLASLAAEGGCVYLVDTDATAMRFSTLDPVAEDLMERYVEFHSSLGNDLSAGLRLGDLLNSAGLTVERYVNRSQVFQIPPGMRPPAWAARDDMAAAGFATAADIERWGEALARLDSAESRPWFFPATFVAIGRRTGPVR